jgi:transcriptional regulator with XRE-family HTH domain
VSSLDEVTRRALGKLLRELRKREGLTLSALSQQVGVSQSALSQFESGRTEPSLGTLWSLGRALNASLFDFFAAEPAQTVSVTRANERTVMVYERARYEAVTRSSKRRMDLFYLHLRPGEGPVREAIGHAGEECCTVLSGQMDVTVGADTYRLGVGDGMWFISDQPHTFSVVGDEKCVSVWADTLPDHAAIAAPHEMGSLFDPDPAAWDPTDPESKQ